MDRQLIKWPIRKLFWGGLRHFLTDKQYARLRYWLELDRSLNLQNPQRFTEKIQYIKLYQRRELRKKIANRMETRKYVAQKIGEDFLVPLIGAYDTLTPQIWESLPEKFVLKANHGCGMFHIVLNKAEEDYASVRQKTEEWKNFDYAEFGREWAYKGLPRTIIAEELLLDSNQSIPQDYKFYCFNGRVKLIHIHFDRFGNPRRNLYDRNFNRINAKLLFPNYEGEVEKPEDLEKAIEVAEVLASDLNFVRVDLYLLEDHIYFGELTNYPGNGFIPFEPEAMEYKIGSLLEL
ncbi:MAG TPA: ATP-grasp fold amidoligase family protein [Balneolaceae bacterium]|nr:ATP-grasp fold amidoligase family protein [Balneolaceae bacterium]